MHIIVVMKIEDLNYYLPEELIAQQPSSERTQSRLLVLERAKSALKDRVFANICDYFRAGDCLVLNNTRVLAARFFATRQSGAKLEGLFLEQGDSDLWHVMLKNSRKIKQGEEIRLLDTKKGDYCGAIASVKLDDGTWLLDVKSSLSVEKTLEVIGFAPLPPYIKREQGGDAPEEDRERYQTVFARDAGAVAAPTAGLHFTDELIDKLCGMGVEFAEVTLHVGAGTFKPVTCENVEDHEIHSERYCVSAEAAAKINAVKKRGGRVIAIGTTSIRTLESSCLESGEVVAGSGDTRLFVMPGYRFKVIDGMVTNFHLPKSTLLALVGAFTGMEQIMAAYQHAVEKGYRFFSYGDAMLIL